MQTKLFKLIEPPSGTDRTKHYAILMSGLESTPQSLTTNSNGRELVVES